MTFEDPARQFADVPLVLDDQNRRPGGLRYGGCHGWLLGLDRSNDPRKIHAKGRAAAELRRDLDPAATLLDDPMDGRQTKAGPTPQRFGREERIEDPGDGIGRDSCSRV